MIFKTIEANADNKRSLRLDVFGVVHVVYGSGASCRGMCASYNQNLADNRRVFRATCPTTGPTCVFCIAHTARMAASIAASIAALRRSGAL